MERALVEATLARGEYTVQSAMRLVADNGGGPLPETLQEAGEVHERAHVVASWRRRARGGSAAGVCAPAVCCRGVGLSHPEPELAALSG
eukprot:6759729-Alexandrium_andersonii.AAC.1